MPTFEEDYEALCAAMALLDTATDLVQDFDKDVAQDLTDIRNKLNKKRLEILKPFGERAWHVSDIQVPS